MAELDDTGSSSFSDASLHDDSASPRAGAGLQGRRLSEDAIGRKLRQDEAELEAELQVSGKLPNIRNAAHLSNGGTCLLSPSPCLP